MKKNTTVDLNITVKREIVKEKVGNQREHIMLTSVAPIMCTVSLFTL